MRIEREIGIEHLLDYLELLILPRNVGRCIHLVKGVLLEKYLSLIHI